MHGLGRLAVLAAGVLFVALAPVRGAVQDPGTASISGHIYLPSGTPAGAGLKVTLRTPEAQIMTILSDKNGDFRFGPIQQGIYYVDVTSDTGKYLPATIQLAVLPGSQNFENIYLSETLTRPKNPTGQRVTSVASLQADVPRAAQREYDRAVKLVKKGDDAAAVEALERALAIYPAYAEAHNDLGVQLLKSGKLREAEEQFRSAIKLDTHAFNPHLNLGLVLVDQADYTNAVEEFRRAVSVDSSQASGHLYLGIALTETGELQEADVELRKALLAEGRYTVAYYYLGRVYAKRGDRQEAIKLFRTYLEQEPTGEFREAARAMIDRLK